MVEGLRNRAFLAGDDAGDYLNLLSNALNVIEDGRFLPPSRRPGWDKSKKSDRLLRSSNIPGFTPGDYKLVVQLICSESEPVRRGAQRLLKLFPSNNFYKPLKDLVSSSPSTCDRRFLAESSANYFYNRIVEFDGTFDLQEKERAWITGNYSEGSNLIDAAAAADPGARIYQAMLDYAVGSGTARTAPAFPSPRCSRCCNRPRVPTLRTRSTSLPR